jgi:hypothetical protein
MAMQIPGIDPAKAASGWKTVKNLVADVVGPMAVLGIAAQKFVSLTAGAALNAEKLRRALAASQGAEQLRKQFEVLGLSAEQARKKVEGVAKVASGSAFSFESLATAAKNLQVLGGSALSTAGMLRKVQDVAAATGAPVDNVATAIGEMYAALERGGSGAGAAAAQLASMGAISQATAQKISEISAAGGPAADSLRAMQGDLAKANGASAQMASSLTGLQAQLANLQNANDIKIGDMFLEGEKAGYRAAIAMEKLRGKVDEVASAPFAAISSQFSKLKESIANILGSDQGIETIKSLFTFLSTVAVAAVGVVVAQIIQFVAFLGGMAVAALKTAAGVKTLSGALSFAGGALKNWATLLASATVRMNVYAAAIMLVVAKVLEARAAIDALADAQKNLNQTNAKELGGLKQKRLMVSTPEEKQAAMKDFDASISANDEALANAKKERDGAAAQFEEKNSYAYNLNPLNWVDSITGGQYRAAQELNMKETQVNTLQNQGISLRDERGRLAAMDATTLGLDSEQDKRERDKLRLEDDIRKNSRQRVAAMASPAQASGLIESELYDAEGKLSRSEEASQRSFEERGNLYTAQAGALVAGDAGTKDFSAKGYSDSLDAMKQVDTQTESGRLSKDLAIRETLRNERASTQGALAQQAALGASADPETRKRLLEKENVINAQIQAIGGEGKISGRSMQQLEADRDRAMEKEDPVKARQEVEAVKARKQQVDEAKAADKSSIDAGNRKLALEKRLAAIKDLEGGAGKAAEMQGDEELKNLKDRLQATREVEKATAKFNASSEAERPQAQKELDKVRIAAKGKGFQDGDTTTSINREIAGVAQITELRKQQAAIEQAAAQRRRDDLMNEIKVANQINQIRVARATGGGMDTTERDVQRDDLKRKQSDLEKARDVAAARDAAVDAGNTALANTKKKELEALGVDGNASANDISTKIAQNIQNQQNMRAEDVVNRSAAQDDTKLAIARTKEDYGVTRGEREAGREERRRLEDESAKKRLREEYESRGFSGGMGGEAERMAEMETRKQRLLADDAEAGAPRIDSLTAIGGGATGSVGPVKNIQEELKRINEQMLEVLTSMDQRTQAMEGMARTYQPDGPGM